MEFFSFFCNSKTINFREQLLRKSFFVQNDPKNIRKRFKQICYELPIVLSYIFLIVIHVKGDLTKNLKNIEPE